MQRLRPHTAAFFAALFLVGAFFLGTDAAAAATLPLPQCDLNQQIEQLATLKGETNSAPVTELKLRQDLLKATITCAIADIDATHATLEGLVTHTGEDKAMRIAFLADLQTARAYYAAQETVATTLDSISGTRRLAQDINTWREQDYLDMYWEATEFIALVRNGDLIRSANTRLGQVKEAVNDLDLEEDVEISALVKDADGLIDTARTEQTLARAGLRLTPRSAPESILDHSKRSLDALRTTYTTFFSISDAAKRAVSQ